MIGFLPTPIPAVQTVGGVARNEEIYDTELVNSGVNILSTQIRVFNNFAAFATVTAPAIGKQPGRDTNLGGAGTAGLPQGVQHFAYAWSNEIHCMDASLNTAANAAMFEQINRYRRLSFAQLVINQTNAFMTVRLPDLVSSDDSLNVQSTFTDMLVVAPDVGDRKGKSMTSTQRYKKNDGQEVTVRNSPYIFQPMQAFSIVVSTPATATGNTFLLTVPIAVVMKFWGITVRGIG